MPYLKDSAYQLIKQKIIDCEYVPGSIINESFLMEELNISRTPIREALNKLIDDNLVIILPKKGIKITELSLDFILQIYDARIAIEPCMVREFLCPIPEEKLISFSDELKSADTVNRIIELDDSFHQLLYSLCTNRFIQNLAEQLQCHNHRIRSFQPEKKLVYAGNDEHIEIVNALLDNDNIRASELVELHLLNAKERAIIKYK